MLSRVEFLAWWSGHASAYKMAAQPPAPKTSTASTLLARTLAGSGTPRKPIPSSTSLTPVSPLVKHRAAEPLGQPWSIAQTPGTLPP